MVSINEVNLRRARLVLGWVTVSVFNSRCRIFISYITSLPVQLNLAIPSWVGTMSTGQRVVTPCGWGEKAGMVRVWVAGKTVWSPCYTQAISERFSDKDLCIKRYYIFICLLYCLLLVPCFLVNHFNWITCKLISIADILMRFKYKVFAAEETCCEWGRHKAIVGSSRIVLDFKYVAPFQNAGDSKKNKKAKAKARDSYIARITGKPEQPRFTIIRHGSWLARANGAAALKAAVHCTCKRTIGLAVRSQRTHHRPNQPHQAFTP